MIVRAFLLLVFLVITSYAKNVVIFNSYHSTFSWTANQTHSIIETLQKSKDYKFDLYLEYMDTKRIKLTSLHERKLLSLYQYKYKNIKIDSVIATDDNALNFLMKYRNKLFTDANIVFSGVNNINVLNHYPKKDITGVYERMTPRVNYSLAKRINPNLETLYLLGDDSITFKVLKQIFISELEPLGIKYKFVSSSNLKDITDELSLAPKNSVAMVVMLASVFNEDKSFLTIKDILNKVSESFNYPILSTAEVFTVGGNVIGGYCVDGAKQGELASELLLKQYKKQKFIQPILKDANRYIFDYDALNKFSLSVDDFQPLHQYKLINEPQSFYEQYKQEIIFIIIFILVIFLINVTAIIYSLKLKKSNEKLAEANKNIMLFMDSTLEGVLISKNGRCIYANSEAANILRYGSKEELVGVNLLTLAAPFALKSLAKRFKMDLAKAEENYLRTKDNQNIGVLIMGRNIVVDDEVVRVSSFVDISESKRKDKLLFEQSKLASMGEMIGNIAHQWRQPLSVISTASTGVKIQKELGMLSDEQFNESMDGILESTNYLSQTIDDFRNYIRGEKTIQTFDLVDPINKTMKLLKASFDFNNIQVTTDYSPNLRLSSCQNELSQVLINILNNARDAILINQEEDQRHVFISTREYDEEHVLISIKDNAGGIPKEIMDKILEPYFTTKDKSQGTGLGLYMSYKLVAESLGGNIFISNSTFTHDKNIFHGAVFDIMLPKEYAQCAN